MKLVGLALTKWAPHVPDRAFRLLMRMAMTALDEPKDNQPAEMFYGGRDLLVSVLRAERNGSLKSVEKAVERGLNDLVAVGAIERMNRPRVGRRAEYRLTLFNAIRIDSHGSAQEFEGDTHGGAEGDTHVPEGDTHGGAEGDTRSPQRATPTVPPRRNEEKPQEKEEEQREEEGVDQRGPVTVRAHASEEKAQSNSQCGNEDCFEINGTFYIPNPAKTKGQRNIRCPTCSPPNVIPFGRRTA